MGGHGGCERRIEVNVKIKKKVGGSGLVGDGGIEGLGGDWSRGGGWLVARFGVGGDVWYGGMEQRIEGIVQY